MRACKLEIAKPVGASAAAQATKLANVLHAHELQRRLGPRGVRACAVDPGSVATGIYRDSALFSRQPLKWLITKFYAPPWDGASAVVHAASAQWRRPPAREQRSLQHDDTWVSLSLFVGMHRGS
jgi:NAD(P)-dependent dehydrogenase (short-subunit alcohol dehydrogenase family)